MFLAHHGGECCGIRHIHGLQYSPQDYAPPLRAEKPKLGFSRAVYPANSRVNVFDGYAPEEDAEGRLRRYIQFCERFRPRGIIEVVTANDWEDSDEASDAYDDGDFVMPENPTNFENGQTEEWREVLYGLGFAVVNCCVNSNTGNHITVWHRNSGEVPQLPDPDGDKKKTTTDPFA